MHFGPYQCGNDDICTRRAFRIALSLHETGTKMHVHVFLMMICENSLFLLFLYEKTEKGNLKY